MQCLIRAFYLGHFQAEPEGKGKGRKALLCCVRLQPGHHHSVPPAVAAAFLYQHFSAPTIFPSAGKFSYQQKKLFQFPPPVLAPVLFSFLLEHTALFFSYEVLLPSSLEYKLIFGLDEPTHGLLYGRKEGKKFVLNT